jgi:hypothetical protein
VDVSGAHRKEASHIYRKEKGLKEALNGRDAMKEIGDLSVSTKFVGGSCCIVCAAKGRYPAQQYGAPKLHTDI